MTQDIAESTIIDMLVEDCRKHWPDAKTFVIDPKGDNLAEIWGDGERLLTIYMTAEDAGRLVVAFRQEGVAARLKSTNLVKCPECSWWHPSDNSECTDDAAFLFEAPDDVEDESDYFDDWTPGGSFTIEDHVDKLIESANRNVWTKPELAVIDRCLEWYYCDKFNGREFIRSEHGWREANPNDLDAADEDALFDWLAETRREYDRAAKIIEDEDRRREEAWQKSDYLDVLRTAREGLAEAKRRAEARYKSAHHQRKMVTKLLDESPGWQDLLGRSAKNPMFDGTTGTAEQRLISHCNYAPNREINEGD